MASGKKGAVVAVLRLGGISTDGGTQAREAIDEGLVVEYTEAMGGGADFPPLSVFHDGTAYWLVDGFHRLRAAALIGLEEFACAVTREFLEAARWHVLTTNALHGKRRSNADKRRCVGLAFDMCPELSDGAIAAHVGVSQPFVSKLRKARTTHNGYGPMSRVGLDGRTIVTSGIGKPAEVDSLDAGAAGEAGSIREQNLELRTALVEFGRGLIEAGRNIQSIRSLLTEEQFLSWTARLGITAGQARAHMRITHEFGDGPLEGKAASRLMDRWCQGAAEDAGGGAIDPPMGRSDLGTGRANPC
jgi:hypothetical protein